MQVVARQEHDFARPKGKTFSIVILYPKEKLALDDIVIRDQMRCGPESRSAIFGCDVGCDAPRCEEFRVQEHPAGQMHDPQDVR
jgi:hypothetical protein